MNYYDYVELRSGRLTHMGQQRQLNQDSFLAIDINRVSRSMGLPIGVYAVADGMGGQSSGEVASALVIDTLIKRIEAEAIGPFLTSNALPFMDPTSWMREVTAEANQAIYDLRQEMGNDMGTTLVWTLMVEDTAYIANVGDSRAYLVNQDKLRQITQDHSLVEQMVTGGLITAEEARVHPHRNVIYRTMGHAPQVEADIFVEHLNDKDRLLLCSDGLSSMLTDKALWQGALFSPSLSQSCAHLVQMANEAGGKDNITVILVELTVL